MLKKIILPLLLLLTSSVYLYTATNRAILDDGDALYASVARQMVERGDWVTPYANGVRFLDKPPMMYWLMGLAYKILGITEVAARLPSFLAILGIGCLIYLMGKQCAGFPAGFTASSACFFCVGTFLFTLMVFPDILLVFFLTVSLYGFLKWYSNPAYPVWASMLYFASLSAAMLTKGMIGVVFPAAIVLLFLTLKTELYRLRRFHLGKGTILFLALALPWHLLAAKRNPGFLWYYFINEQVLRFFGKRQPADYQSIPVFIFWVLILVWFFPWSAFLPVIVSFFRNAHSRLRDIHPFVLLCLIWITVVLGFFSFSARAEHYSLPIIPPLALLTGIALFPQKLDDTKFQRLHDKWINRTFSFLLIIGAIIGIAICGMITYLIIKGKGLPQSDINIHVRNIRAYSYYFAPIFDIQPQILEQLRPFLMSACLVLSLGLLSAWWINFREQRLQAVLVLSAMMSLFFLCAYKSLCILEDSLSSKQFGLELARLYRPDDCVVTFGDFEAANSINFYSPVLLKIYSGTADLLNFGLQYPDAPQLILSRDDFESRWNSSRRTFFIIPDQEIEKMNLKNSNLVLRNGGRILLCNLPIKHALQYLETEELYP